MSDREDAQRRIVSALAQHVSYLHRTGTAHVNRTHEIIDELAGELARELGERLDNLTPAELQAFARGRYHTSRLKGLRNAIDKWAATLGERIETLSMAELATLADQEAGYMRDLIAQAVEGDMPPAPAAAAAALSRPVMGEFVEDMLADLAPATRKRVYSTIRQGVSEGQSNSQIIRALRGTRALRYKDGVMQTTRNAAERLVRTARQHVSNEAYRETYQALGVTHVVWVAQLEGRTCKRCAPLDSRRWKIDDPRPEPPLHPNCLVGDSLVTSAGGVTNASKRWFDGEVVVIRTASGRELTCTPNHPILTSAGWVAAKDVNAVGDVVSYSGGKWEGFIDGHDEHVIPTIHEVAEAFFGSGEMAPIPVPVSPEHFHGDGAGSHVAVIGADGLLRNERMAALFQHAAKLDFVLGAATPSGGFPELGPLALGLKRILLAASGFMSLADKMGNLLWGAGTHASCLLLSTVPHFAASGFNGQLNGTPRVSKPGDNASMAHAGIKEFSDSALHHVRDESPASTDGAKSFGLEDAGYSLVGDVELERRLLDGESFKGVFVDHVVDHVVRPFSGHVYNLETETGYYYANGIITHNCRCSVAPSLDGDVMGKRPYVRALKVTGRDGNSKFRSIGNMTKKQREAAGLEVGQVGAGTTYADWFSRQDARFQKEWLGDTRYKLYKKGGYSIDRFTEPRGGKEYTLDELRQRDRETFKELFGESA